MVATAANRSGGQSHTVVQSPAGVDPSGKTALMRPRTCDSPINAMAQNSNHENLERSNAQEILGASHQLTIDLMPGSREIMFGRLENNVNAPLFRQVRKRGGTDFSASAASIFATNASGKWVVFATDPAVRKSYPGSSSSARMA